MSYLGNNSDVEQDKAQTDFRLNRSNNNITNKPVPSNTKFSDMLWNNKREKSDDSDSEISDSGNFLAKGTEIHYSYKLINEMFENNE